MVIFVCKWRVVPKPVTYVTIVEYCCRYNVGQQSNIGYSDVKQSVSIDNTIKNPTYVNTARPSEPEYEAIVTAHKPDHDVKVVANPAYHSTS